ncbi:cation transport ATPase [Streptomyces sp. TE33382]
MSSVLDRRPAPAAAGPRPAASSRRTRVLALPEARWALAALVLFLIALPLNLLGAPVWLWAPLFAATYITGGWEPGWEGLKALKDKTLDVDLLMVVAALGAAAIGQVVDGALLIVIFATSGALEAMATARTADSVRGLLDLAPSTATRMLPDGGEEIIAAESLKVGDIVLVRPGERVGADGLILEGASDVDQATITGEPLPVAKQAGDEVFAGTVNGTGALRVRVERDPSDSVIARIVKMVEEASGTKAPTQLFIEKIEQRYSIGMVLATVAVFAIPLAFGSALQPALLRAMTFMIVASPCAVVLSTMPPLLSAIANAGRHGVLTKSAVVMERLGQVDAVALDKTGTLTEGAPPASPPSALCPVPGWMRTRCSRWRPPPSTPASTPSPAPSSTPPAHAGCTCPKRSTSPPPPAWVCAPPSKGAPLRSDRPAASRSPPKPRQKRWSNWRRPGRPRCWSCARTPPSA